MSSDIPSASLSSADHDPGTYRVAPPDPVLVGGSTRPLVRRHRDPRTTFLVVVGLITVLYVATFVRGLWWQWKGIVLAQPATAPVVAGAPRSAAARPVGAAPGNAAARKPLTRTDAPAPRNVTDERGVTYDANGVAVMGIDADPSGVYNVPPGRQLRIGGPEGALFDVGDGGRLVPAAKR